MAPLISAHGVSQLPLRERAARLHDVIGSIRSANTQHHSVVQKASGSSFCSAVISSSLVAVRSLIMNAIFTVTQRRSLSRRKQSPTACSSPSVVVHSQGCNSIINAGGQSPGSQITAASPTPAIIVSRHASAPSSARSGERFHVDPLFVVHLHSSNPQLHLHAHMRADHSIFARLHLQIL